MMGLSIKPLSEDFMWRIAESKTMVSRSLEKMMLIVIGLSTAVIVGVPILMYSIETINTTTQLQGVELMVSKIHDATITVDSELFNTTTTDIWVNPGVTVNAVGNSLMIVFNPDSGSPRTWSQTYLHEIVIDNSISTHLVRTLYTMEVDMIDNIIHISFYAVPI
jgi:hypothetical protein